MSSSNDACCMPAGQANIAVQTKFVSHKTLEQAFVEFPASTFLMGSEDSDANVDDHEGPVKEVELEPFAMATTAVSNAQFRRFVRETKYRTTAERFGGSFVFRHFLSKRIRARQTGIQQVEAAPWWCEVEGASWRHPEGPGSNIRNRGNHPVVHISWNDAEAFCSWAGCVLPTEAQWEFAARGGLVQNRFPWGNELTPAGNHQCNIWQGQFPHRNTGEDGFIGTAPVDAFAPNGYGLFNVAGNVWEWCSDWFRDTTDNRQFRSGKVLKGGSYLCHASYCNRYRVAARYANAPTATTGNCGFRVMLDRSLRLRKLNNMP